MGKFRLILIALVLSNAFFSYGQNKPELKVARNSIHLSASLFQFVGMYSLNYERSIFFRDHIRISLGSGIGEWYYAIPISRPYYGFSLPLYTSALLSRNNNHFEIDLGLRYTLFSKGSNKDNSPYYPELNLGYRFQRIDGKGLLFRSFIGLSGIGIGLGKAF